MQELCAAAMSASAIAPVSSAPTDAMQMERAPSAYAAAMASPAELLRDKNGMFAKLVAETGEQSERNLRARAEECEAARAAGTPIRRVGSKSALARETKA